MKGFDDETVGGAVSARTEAARSLFARYAPHASSLLDVGVGAGIIARDLGSSLEISTLFGIDLFREYAVAARSNGIHALVADLDAGLPLKSGSFDAVFCGEVLEHMLDPDQLLEELRRVLAPTGVCVLTTPNLASWVNRISLLFGWTPPYVDTTRRSVLGRPAWAFPQDRPNGHIHVMTVSALCELLKSHSFEVLECVPYGLRGNMSTRKLREGSMVRRALVSLVWRTDVLLSARPQLAIGVLVALRHAT